MKNRNQHDVDGSQKLERHWYWMSMGLSIIFLATAAWFSLVLDWRLAAFVFFMFSSPGITMWILATVGALYLGRRNRSHDAPR